MLALGLPNAAWALWSPEPTESPEAVPFSAAVSPAADDQKAVLGYTPPPDVMSLAEQRKKDDAPLTRRLDAGQAAEAIEIPLIDKDAAVAGGTFTRVDRKLPEERKKADAAAKRKPEGSGRTSETPIPAPASPWLMLIALPALFMVGRRFRA